MSRNSQNIEKLSRVPIKFPKCPETFRNVSGNFPECHRIIPKCQETFRVDQKLSRVSKNFPNCLEPFKMFPLQVTFFTSPGKILPEYKNQAMLGCLGFFLTVVSTRAPLASKVTFYSPRLWLKLKMGKIIQAMVEFHLGLRTICFKDQKQEALHRLVIRFS